MYSLANEAVQEKVKMLTNEVNALIIADLRLSWLAFKFWIFAIISFLEIFFVQI
jgi:hypothetical protein